MHTKKLLFALCLLASSFVAYSQAQETIKQEGNTYLDKGTWLLGTNLSYFNIKQKISFQSGGGQIQTYSGTSETFLGSIAASNLISSQFALGGKITYVNTNGNDVAILGPLIKVFFNDSKPIIPFFTGEIGFSTKKDSDTSYNAGLGLAFFLNKNVSFDLTGTYGNTFSLNGLPQSTSGSTSFRDVSTGVFALQVGLQIYLPKKKI